MRAQKNYAGHRLAPWLSHVMVSRQETMRQLMTPGEVMQLPDDQEVIMLSGQPPIKAQKLRYFEDENFSDRILPQIDLSADGHYQDRPPPRFDDWAGRVCNPKPSSTTVKSAVGYVDEGGMERHPTIETESHIITPEIETDILGLLDEDVDVSASSPNSDPLKQITPTTIQRAHELTRDGDHDLDM